MTPQVDIHTGIISGLAEELGWDHVHRSFTELPSLPFLHHYHCDFFTWVKDEVKVGVQIIEGDLFLFYNGSVSVDNGFGNVRGFDLNNPELVELVGEFLGGVLERKCGI